MLQLINTNTVALTAGQTIPVTEDFNTCDKVLDFSPTTNEIIFKKSGIYEVVGSFTFTATAAGTVTISGETSTAAIPGMTETNTVAEGGTVGYNVAKLIRIAVTSGSYARLNYSVSAAGNMLNSVIYVTKVR